MNKLGVRWTLRTAQAAWRRSIRDVLGVGHTVEGTSDPLSIGSQFGTESRSILEILGYSFAISDPLVRVVRSSIRRIDVRYCFANALWVLKGSDDLEMIEHYNPRGRHFTDDGKKIAGAHGRRLRAACEIDQLAAAEARLRMDRGSRRAVASIYLPRDSTAASRDIPCGIAIQFLIRDGKLVMLTFMRSQSVLMVMPHDVFAFTFLQEWLGTRLGIPLGDYIHIAGSAHIYADEVERAEATLKADRWLAPRSMPPMPMTGDDLLRRIIDTESELRSIERSGRDVCVDIDRYGLPRYWADFLSVLAPSTCRTKIAASARSRYYA